MRPKIFIPLFLLAFAVGLVLFVVHRKTGLTNQPQSSSMATTEGESKRVEQAVGDPGAVATRPPELALTEAPSQAALPPVVSNSNSGSNKSAARLSKAEAAQAEDPASASAQAKHRAYVDARTAELRDLSMDD